DGKPSHLGAPTSWSTVSSAGIAREAGRSFPRELQDRVRPRNKGTSAMSVPPMEPAAATPPASAKSAETTWDAAIARYARLVYSVPLRFGLSRADADDVFQATWLVAVRKSALPPAADRIVRWLVSIASWEARAVMRRRRP